VDSSVRILLVDDDARFLDALEALLETLPGIEVAGRATNGLEAIDKAAIVRPDVVLIDLDMPRLNGVEATRRIKALSPGTTIVVLSGSDVIAHSNEAIDAGAVAYIRKSNTVRDLPTVLDSLRLKE
jgi:DNA-binding NarL/FixJ family response regulator